MLSELGNPSAGGGEGAVHMINSVFRPVCSAVTLVGGGLAVVSGKLFNYEILQSWYLSGMVV